MSTWVVGALLSYSCGCIDTNIMVQAACTVISHDEMLKIGTKTILKSPDCSLLFFSFPVPGEFAD